MDENTIGKIIDILFEFNNPANPNLVRDGMGVLPLQTEWVMDRLGQNYGHLGGETYDRIYAWIQSRTDYEGFGYTHWRGPVR